MKTPNPPLNRGAPSGVAVGAHHHEAVTKSISITRSDIGDYRKRLQASAEETLVRIAELTGTESPLDFLFQLKFETVGCDPLNPSRPLNLVEQLNQTFTYLASFNGALFLFDRHPKVRRLTLNLGTAAGYDIETSEDGGIAAEVFAAVTPQNNGKLASDIAKVSTAGTQHRYVLFISPEYKEGPHRVARKTNEVIVWSLGCNL